MNGLFGNIMGRLGVGITAPVAPADPLAVLRAEHERIFLERRAARADRQRAAEAGCAAAKARRLPDPIMADRDKHIMRSAGR